MSMVIYGMEAQNKLWSRSLLFAYGFRKSKVFITFMFVKRKFVHSKAGAIIYLYRYYLCDKQDTGK